MVNPETGKPKGYGFADFADADAAASAVRNLNEYEIMGRKIRVDWPHNELKDTDSIPDQSELQVPPPVQAPPPTDPMLPPLPPGTDVAPNLSAPNAISMTLSALPPQQLLDVVVQMKGLVMADPARATELLRQAPQLAYAIFQALLLMNLVDQSVLASVVEQASQPQIVVPPPQTMTPQPFTSYGTPPVNPTFQQPVQQIPGQGELLAQVINMPQATIDALPPTERAQIMLLRQQLMQGGLR